MIRLFPLIGLLLVAASASSQGTRLATTTAEIREIPREVRLDGVVEAVRQTTVAAQTQGQIEQILYDVDDFVEKDAVIVLLRDAEQSARLRRAEAELKEADARLREAQDEFGRTREIYAKKLVAKSELDRAEANLKSAQARLAAARAGLEQSREQHAYTRVRAPYSGVVTKRHVEVGEMAQPGQPLISGISLEELRVRVDVPQRLAPRIRQASVATISVSSGTVRPIASSEITVFPYADSETNTFRARIELPPETRGLFPGMYVKTRFRVGVEPVLAVPAESVVFRSEVTGVYVVDENGWPSLRQVRLGRSADELTVILAGIEEGEKVALDPIQAGLARKRQGD